MTEPLITSLRSVYSLTGSRPPAPRIQQRLMGTDAVIQIVGGASALLDKLFARAKYCESLWTRFASDSDICRLNSQTGTRVEVDPITVDLIREMQAAFIQTRGSFNPTVLPALVEAGYESSIAVENLGTRVSPPHEATLYRSLDGIEIDGTTVRLPKGMTVDAGGIAKGYTADLIIADAAQAGAFGAMAIIGGDVRVWGEAPDGGPWRIGVDDPFEPGRHIEVVRLVDGGIATSSQRKRRFQDGATHHLIDPRTGLSTKTDVQTVTVIAGSGRQAEVLTKPGFLWPANEFLDWLPTMNAAGLVTFSDRSTRQSPNWKTFV